MPLHPKWPIRACEIAAPHCCAVCERDTHIPTYQGGKADEATERAVIVSADSAFAQNSVRPHRYR